MERGIVPAEQRPQVRTVRIELSLRSIFSILAIVIGLWLLARIWQILLVFVIAVVLAGTFSPIVDLLERRRIKRSIALAGVLFALLGAVVGLGFLVIPALAGQISDATRDAPEYQRRLADFMAGSGFAPLVDRAAAVRDAQPGRYLAPVGRYALTYAQAAVELVAYGVTTVVLAFYLISDRERVQGFLYALLPRRFHLRTARVLLNMETVVGGYVRGQAFTSLTIGVFVFALLRVIGVPNALALAIFAAFTDLIPFIGGILVTVPAVLAALALGVWPAVIVWAAISIYQEFESRVLVPRVYGQTLRLSPVAVTLALLIGGKLLGIVGALLALPLAAGLRVLVEELRIELPGEQPGERAQQELDERAEALYAEQSQGTSAVEAAVLATELAELMQEEEVAATGRVEVPAEERRDTVPADPSPLAPRGNPDAPPYPNPAG